MVVFVGFLIIAARILALVKFKVLPLSAFATLPVLAALALGFGVTDVMTLSLIHI